MKQKKKRYLRISRCLLTAFDDELVWRFYLCALENNCKGLICPCVGILQESTGISDGDFVSYVPEWRKAGAQLIGGCCRTTPATIGAISKALHEDCVLGYK